MPMWMQMWTATQMETRTRTQTLMQTPAVLDATSIIARWWAGWSTSSAQMRPVQSAISTGTPADLDWQTGYDSNLYGYGGEEVWLYSEAYGAWYPSFSASFNGARLKFYDDFYRDSEYYTVYYSLYSNDCIY